VEGDYLPLNQGTLATQRQRLQSTATSMNPYRKILAATATLLLACEQCLGGGGRAHRKRPSLTDCRAMRRKARSPARSDCGATAAIVGISWANCSAAGSPGSSRCSRECILKTGCTARPRRSGRFRWVPATSPCWARRSAPQAAAEFQRARGYAPTEIQVATGSLDVNFFDYAHMIFVHRDNPLGQLTLAQLEAIFGTEGKRGAGQVRTWGDLGLTGEWADNRPIQPYGWKVDEDFALFFRERVLGDSHRWNPGDQASTSTSPVPDGTQYDHGQQILDALSADRLRHRHLQCPLRHARRAHRRPGLAPGRPRGAGVTKATLIAQQFPLVRIIPGLHRPRPRPAGGRPPCASSCASCSAGKASRRLVEETGYLPISARDQRQATHRAVCRVNHRRRRLLSAPSVADRSRTRASR
jgi:hypothetical protein